ncbi:MAG: hypothetical protein R2911_05490 [Caldilineaceae bacterium]
MKPTNKQTLWLRWVLANAVGEMLGLGATFAVLVYFFINLGNQGGVTAILLSFLVDVFSGVLEATIVGLAQWWAMHPWFPAIKRRAWWIATLIGALLAYILGYLPSTVMDLGAEAGAAPVAEPPQWIILLFAAGMGLVGGAVLSFAQWWVMRGKVDGAAWWMPANMLAWLIGMPIIFWAIDAAQKGQPPLQAGLLLAVALLITGAVVGAIEGVFLVRLTPGAA